MTRNSIHDMDTTAANNTDVDGVSVAEGTAPSNINDAIRSENSILKEQYLDEGFTLSLTGTDTLSVTLNQTFASLGDGLKLTTAAVADNTGAVTLNVNAKGAMKVKKKVGGTETELAANDIISGGIYSFVYDEAIDSAAGGWWLVNITNTITPNDAALMAVHRNKVINGIFVVNQRGGTKTPGVGIYGYDRWKGHADGLEQPIEALPAGDYTLTWGGGGNGTFGGTTATSPFKATSAGGDVSVIVPATATRVSLVPGDATAEADPFSPRHIQQELALCQRYYELLSISVGNNIAIGHAYLTTAAIWALNYQYKRVAPSVVFNSPTLLVLLNASGNALVGAAHSLIASDNNFAKINTTVSTGLVVGNAASVSSNGSTPTIGISAEL